jgi:hypothetical protein
MPQSRPVIGMDKFQRVVQGGREGRRRLAKDAIDAVGQVN